MSFIDSSYLFGEIYYPNLTANATMLTAAISQYEKEILIKALGYKLYSLLIADCVYEVPQTEKYLKLVNGAEFEHESVNGETITLKWEGLKNTQKQSLIAFFAFYKIVGRETTHLGNAGVFLQKAEGGERISPEDKMIISWNRMIELYGSAKLLQYPMFPGVAYSADYFQISNDDPSLFNYLYANKDDFADWLFTPLSGINKAGL